MIASETFLQQVALLVLGALVTGWGVPVVLGRIDARKQREQKEFQASIARQGKLLDSQSALLDEITRIVWAWRYLAKRVVYYGSRGDHAQYETAKSLYEDGVWILLHGLRTQTSKARRLVSDKAFEKLNEFYIYMVHDVDLQISELANKAGVQVLRE